MFPSGSGSSAERKNSRFRRYVLGSIIFLSLALAATHTFLHRTSVGSQRFVRMTFLVYAGTFLAVLALLILATILGRNLIKLYFEKKRGKPGSGFKSKLVRIFIGLSLLPALLLFVFAYALINSSIEKWFLAPPAQIQESSRELTRQYYDDTEKRAKYYAGIIAGQLEAYLYAEKRPRDDFSVSDLPDKLREYCRAYAINTVQIFDATGSLTAESGPSISSPHHQDFRTAMIAEALQGEPQFRFDSAAPKDPGNEICYAAAPLRDAEGRVNGVVLAEIMRSGSLKFWADRVMNAADKYEQLQIERDFLRLNMLMMLALATLLVIFAFAWFALYLSKRITVPVQALVEGAAAVSEGNLAHRVDCQAFDELGILVTSFNKMTADLEENEERIYQMERAAAWQEVAQRLAHEIKNPLTPIRLSAERILNRYKNIADPSPANLPAQQAKELERFGNLLADCVQTIVQETDSLKNLVDEFSRFARLPEARPKDADIRVIIENALHLYDGRVPNIQIIKEFDADMPRLRLDMEQMKRVFINLFDNAIDAMSQNTGRRTLGIHTFPDRIQGTARIEISDNGSGFYDENYDSLFSPYFSTRKGGTGLGLAIVRQIIADHRGSIYAEANSPVGTRIVIDLPLAAVVSDQWSVVS
jgi:nitrogen fixation/metabolism regulation signal transduction histidine kinase